MRKVLFIIDHEPERLDQLMIVVPAGYDRKRVLELAQECGVRSPNILAEIDISTTVDQRIADYADDYAVYGR